MQPRFSYLAESDISRTPTHFHFEQSDSQPHIYFDNNEKSDSPSTTQQFSDSDFHRYYDEDKEIEAPINADIDSNKDEESEEYFHKYYDNGREVPAPIGEGYESSEEEEKVPFDLHSDPDSKIESSISINPIKFRHYTASNSSLFNRSSSCEEPGEAQAVNNSVKVRPTKGPSVAD